MRRARKRHIVVMAAFLISLGAALLSARPALAHVRLEVGPYVMVIGWESEPPIIGERNALVVDISEDGIPVEGVETSLDLNILYGGRTFVGNLAPTATPGHYRVEIFPTVRGQYSVQFSGSIEDVAIDELVEPEEVLPAGVLQFPESPPDTRDLQATIDDLTSQLQTARILAIAGLAIGAVALVIAAIALTRSR